MPAPSLAERLQASGALHVGDAFVFLDPREEASLAWMPGPVVLCRLNRPLALPGLNLAPADLPALDLAILSADKELYAEGEESVHLLAFDPTRPGEAGTAALYRNGEIIRELEIQLDRLGAAHLTFGGLEAGQYQLCWKCAQVSFEVATYKLAPFTARVRRMQAQQGVLSLELELRSYGAPFDGAVSLSLRGRSTRGDCQNGRLELTLALEGEETLELVIQSLDDPSRTASLPLVGTSRSDRRETVLSRLGETLTASLLPEEGSRSVRGLHLRSRGPSAGPVTLQVEGNRAVLQVTQALEHARILVIDPTRVAPYREEQPTPRALLAGQLLGQGLVDEATQILESAETPGEIALRSTLAPRQGDRERSTSVRPLEAHRELAYERLEPGQVLELELPAPLAYLALGAYHQGKPWEATAVLPVAAPELLSLALPENLTPGEAAVLTLQGPAGAAYVVVKDARLLTRSTPESALAGCLKRYPEQRPAPRPLRPPAPPELPPVSPRAIWSPEIRALLLERRDVTERQLARAEETAERAGAGVGSALVALGYVTGSELARLASEVLGLPFVQLTPEMVDPELARCLPEHLAWRYVVVPVAQKDNLLTVAMVDPLDVIAIDDIQLITGFSVEPVLAGAEAIMAALHEAFGVTNLVEVEGTVKDIAAQDFGPLELELEQAPMQLAPPSEELVQSPETVFAGLVTLEQGQAALSFVPGTAELLIEVLALGGLDWSFHTARAWPRKSPHVELETPAFVLPPDIATGRLQVLAGSGELTLWHDQREVLRQRVEPGQSLAFPAFPGTYEARLDDQLQARSTVQEPGNIRRQVRTVLWLPEGQAFEPPADLLGYRVLRNLGAPLEDLVHATANYSHACCEQTSTILLAAAALQGLTNDLNRRAWAEGVVRLGLARMGSMYLPGQGFKLYPEGPNEPNTHYGPIAARNLLQLALLCEPGALAMAEDATRAYGLCWPPAPPRTPQEAYLAARLGDRPGCLPPSQEDAVRRRADQAWTAAMLLHLRQDLEQAVPLANQVLDALEESGRLYSTLDSLAAMALVQELQEHVAGGRLEEGRAVGADLMLELRHERRESWSGGDTELLQAWIEPGRVRAGERVQLGWRLRGGYQTGDLLWVCLPDALSRLAGGGQVKMFSLDCMERSQGTIELVATGPTPAGPQRFLACLRNMYREERLGPASPLTIEVEPPAARDVAPGPASLLPEHHPVACAGHPERAHRLLERLTSGRLELSSGRARRGWLRINDDLEPFDNLECLQAGVALMELAGLPVSLEQAQDGPLEFGGRSFYLHVLPLDTGLRALVEAL